MSEACWNMVCTAIAVPETASIQLKTWNCASLNTFCSYARPIQLSMK